MTRKENPLLYRITAAAIATLAVFACTTQTQVKSRLDSSGLTVVALDDAIVLARPVRRLTVAARDYAYIGPVEINRMGQRDHYLWLGLASTIDRAFADAPPADAESLAIFVDGQPMILKLTDWSANLDRSPYETVVPVYATLSARASLHQIQRIADATSIEVHIISKSGPAFRYRMWQGAWSSWSTFGRKE